MKNLKLNLFKILCLALCFTFILTFASSTVYAISPSGGGSGESLDNPLDTFVTYTPDTDDAYEIKIPVAGKIGEEAVVTLQVYIEGTGLNGCGYSDVRFISTENYIIDDAIPTERWSKITTQTRVLFDGEKSYIKIKLLNANGENIRIKEKVKVSTAVIGEDMLKGATLYMLPCVEMEQNCSFVVFTKEKNLLVFDGGNEGDAEYLVDFLYTLKSEVDHWFISHLHSDHIGAISAVLKDDLIHINNIYHDLPTPAECTEHKDGPSKFYNELMLHKDKVDNFVTMNMGDVIEVDANVSVTVLNEMMHFGNNWGNNTNVCVRMDTKDGETKGESVLFTGDSGIEVGDWLLNNNLEGISNCAIVTAAHHGQAGTSKAFYQAVNSDIWLVPAPTWLWYGSGVKNSKYSYHIAYDTHNVRNWIRDLEVARTYIAKDGIVAIK